MATAATRGTISLGYGTWTCGRCARRSVTRQPGIRKFSKDASGRGGSKSRRRLPLIAAASGGAIAATGVVYTEELRHYYEAAERSGRVLRTLYTNISDYNRTLKHQSERSSEDADSALKACHTRCAKRTLRVLEKNGSIFIKLGQHLSSMGYLLPTEWTQTFIPLQDKCPVSSYESIEAMFLKDLGFPLADMFETFDREPIGSASLAQVHKATLKGTGQEVAVKVQHPHLEEWVPLDMRLTTFSFATLKRWFPEYDMEWLAEEMEISLPKELDFSLEGANAMRAKEYFSKISGTPLVIPEVKESTRRILVMEYIAGKRPDDLDYLDENGIDRDEVSAALSRIFNEMIFGDGAPLHCDPHGGNIAVRKNEKRRSLNFDIILYDHGLYRDIPKQLKRDYAKLWLAVLESDESGMRKYAHAVAGVTDEQFPLFASAITGRDFTTATTAVVSERTDSEKEQISDALIDGLIPQLVQMLGQVPRIILLILKTNDLTRSLDENLQTREGPVRTFLILARYCSRTVFEEQKEQIRAHGSLLRPTNLIHTFSAWTAFMRVELRLTVYEYYLALRRILGAEQLKL